MTSIKLQRFLVTFVYPYSFVVAGRVREFRDRGGEVILQGPLSGDGEPVAQRNLQDRAGSLRELREHDRARPESQQAR